MSTIVELQQRAAALKAKYQKETITPEEVGQLHEDTLAYIADLERYVDNLGVRKTYSGKTEMDADVTPVGTNGKAMRYGQLAVIRSSDNENGNIYAYQKPGWLLIGNLNEGQVINDLVSGGSNVPLSAEQGKVLDGKIEAAVGSIPAVVDNLSTDDATKALSAKQGKVLLEMATEYDVSANNGGKAYTLDGTAQVVRLFVRYVPQYDGNIIVSLGGNIMTVTLSATDHNTPALVAAAIAATTHTAYSVSYTSGNDYVEFTADSVGTKVAPGIDLGTTGSTITIEETTAGADSAVAIVPTEFQRGGMILSFIDKFTRNYVRYQNIGKSWDNASFRQVPDAIELKREAPVSVIGSALNVSFSLTANSERTISGKYVSISSLDEVTGSDTWLLSVIDVSSYIGNILQVNAQSHPNVANIVIYNRTGRVLAVGSTCYGITSVYVPYGASYAKISYSTSCVVNIFMSSDTRAYIDGNISSVKSYIDKFKMSSPNVLDMLVYGDSQNSIKLDQSYPTAVTGFFIDYKLNPVSASTDWMYCKLDLTPYRGKLLTTEYAGHTSVMDVVLYDGSNNILGSMCKVYGQKSLYIPLNASYAFVSFQNSCNVKIYQISSLKEKIEYLYNQVNLLDLDKISKGSVYADATMKGSVLDKFFKAIFVEDKSAYPYGLMACVVGRNASSKETGWIIKLYAATSSFGAGTLALQYKVTDNPEISNSLQCIESNGITIVVDWTQLEDGYYQTSMVGSKYLMSDDCFERDANNGIYIMAKLYSDFSRYMANNLPKVVWNLPKSMSVPTNFNFWYYEDTLIKDYDILYRNGFYFTVSTDCDRNIADGYGNITCNGTYIKFSLYRRNVDQTSTLISLHTITVSSVTKLTSATKNVLVIGDSYTDNTYGSKGMLGWIADFASKDDNVIVSKGIRTNEYGYKAETYQGWNESSFMTYIPVADRASDAPNTRQPGKLVNSPFMFSDDDTVANAKFDFHRYMTDNAIDTLDTIIFFLGMNGGDGSKIYKMIYGDGQVSVQSSIRDALPNVTIIVCMVPSYWGHKEISSADKNTGQSNRISQNSNYVSLFDGLEKVKVCPVNGYNRVYGYRSIDNGLTPYQFTNGNLTGDVALPKFPSKYDHHPSTYGIQALAYNIYNMVFC